MGRSTLFRAGSICVLLALACPACSRRGSGPEGAASGGVASSARVAPQGASASALISEIDGADPWGSLGELTGIHLTKLTALSNDCRVGPEVPFDRRHPSQPFRPFDQSYSGTLEQRGAEIVFELGEGLVFARIEAERLVDIVRIGAEGVTHYLDALEIARAGTGFRISGESDWSFRGGGFDPETCSGTTLWEIDAGGDRPTAGARDLQVVLRWPVTSGADLDLLVGVPPPQSFFPFDSDWRSFVGEIRGRCHVLRSAGAAGSPDDSSPVDWIRPLRETQLPHHEEVIRCAAAVYGDWNFQVVNWSGTERVEFAIEVFEGPSIGIDPTRERWLGLIERAAAPHALERVAFRYSPPPRSSQYGASGTFSSDVRKPIPRPRDPITHSLLGFNKAAVLDVPYAEFLRNVGVPRS